jgi:hypothetical protein
MAKTTVKPNRAAWGKMIIATVGTVFFTIAAGVLSFHAWQAQQGGILMSNGQGGTMTPGKGFGFAAVLLVLALIYGWRVKTLLRPYEKAE